MVLHQFVPLVKSSRFDISDRTQVTKRVIRRLAGSLSLGVLIVGLSACGGGGGGGGGGSSANVAPTANNDQGQASNGTLLKINVVGNDTDADGTVNPATVAIVNAPANGTINAVNSDGTVDYTASNNAPSDTFTYTVRDDDGATSNVATVSISITANAPPVANNDSPGTNQDTPVNINVIANDTDPDGTIDAASVNVVTDPANGVAAVNPNGSIDYTPNAGFFGNDSFTYTVSDDVGAVSNVATVSVLVNSVPVAADSCNNTPLNTVLNDDVSSDVTDPDSTMFNFTVQQDVTRGLLQLDQNTGQFTYTPNAGVRGEDKFTYSVSDLEGGTDTAEFSIVIGDTRIMPLGDSITQGVDGAGLASGEQIGYRKKLLDDMVAAGYSVDFVGGQTNGQSATPPIADPDHEGHPGFKPSQIEAQITSYLNANPADVVLLHVGTNDINTDPVNDLANDVNDILDLIDAWETANNNPVTVFVAQIIERANFNAPFFPNPNVQSFNNALSSLVSTRISAGDSLRLVNQNAVVDPATDLMPDMIHPNPTGYGNMADAWLADINASGSVPLCQP